MLNTIRSIINVGKTRYEALGVSVFNYSTHTYFSFTYIRQKEGNISRIDSGHFTNFEDLNARIEPYVKSNVRTRLNIYGEQIITKGVTNNIVSGSWSTLFPGIKKEEFVIQTNEAGPSTFITLMRHGLIDDRIVDAIRPVEVSVGLLDVMLIKPMLDTQEVNVYDNKVIFKDDNLVAITQGNSELKQYWKIGDEEMTGEDLPSYCAALGVLLHVPVNQEGIPKKISENSRLSSEDFRLYRNGRIALATLLTFAVINATIFLWFNARLNEAEANLRLHEGSSAKARELQGKSRSLVAEYEKLGWELNRLPLYYLDNMAATLPAGLRLTLIEAGKSEATQYKRDRKIIFNQKRIFVAGIADAPAAVNAWVMELGKLNWVSSVQDQRYKFDSRKGGVFEMTIVIE
jgi:hypothetical protein